MKLTAYERKKALRTLEQVIEKMAKEKALVETHSDFSELPLSIFWVGDYTVKLDHSVYSVYSGESCLYNDIVVAEVVFKLLDKLIKNKTSGIKDLLSFEREYVKHLNDMKFYLHSFKMAQNDKSESRFIIQDRFDVSSAKAEVAKHKIRRIR